MTSPTGRFGGFSLLEALITLSIIALFSGYFLVRFEGSSSSRALEKASSELKRAALLAKKRTSAYRRDHFLMFNRKVYLLTDRDLSEAQAVDAGTGTNVEAFNIPPEVGVEILRFGERRWEPLKQHAWRFRSSGLNEPLGIRLSTGQSFVELRFDALTGLAEETASME